MMVDMQTYFRVLAKFECDLILSPTSNPALCFFADRGEHPSEGGGNLKDQPVFPRGQSTYLSISACRAGARD